MNRTVRIPSNEALTGDGYLPARQILDRYRVSQMTLWRWVEDKDMGFPKPVYLGRYRYWRITEIEEWEAQQLSARSNRGEEDNG